MRSRSRTLSQLLRQPGLLNIGLFLHSIGYTSPNKSSFCRVSLADTLDHQVVGKLAKFRTICNLPSHASTKTSRTWKFGALQLTISNQAKTAID